MSRSKGKRRKPRRAQHAPAPAPRQPGGRRVAFAAIIVIAAAVGGWLLWSYASSRASTRQLEFWRTEVIRSFPHDIQAFTQGLLWHRGKLYESTGQYGHSTLRRLDPHNGRVEHQIHLESRFFAEGLALQGNRLIQLTWHEETALLHGLEDFEPAGRFRYSGEGWGLCWDGSRFIMSDGSSVLTFRDPQSFSETGRLQVTLRGQPLSRLNELEWAEGWIYANLWQRDFIVRIDPRSGRVIGQIDAAGLLPAREARNSDVLNGIAYNPQSETFYLTGKYWPRMFEVRFVPRG